MIRVTIEMIPHGVEDRKRHLGTINIINDLTSPSPETGNYRVELKSFNGTRNWKVGTVTDFPRIKRGPYDLLLLALLNTVGSRNGIE